MRFFIIFYTYNYNQNLFHDNCDYGNESYPSRHEMDDYISRNYCYEINNIVITNIIELTKEDWKAWSK